MSTFPPLRAIDTMQAKTDDGLLEMPNPSTRRVVVVDDDAAVSRAIVSALAPAGIEVETYLSAEDFLVNCRRPIHGCLVLDIKLPGDSGLKLQQRLLADGDHVPVIFISGHSDVSMTVQAWQTGAMTLLEKPFRIEKLISEVERACRLSEERREHKQRHILCRRKIDALTIREREVLFLLVRGFSNKQMAVALNRSTRTTDDRRRRLKRKLAGASVPKTVPVVAAAGYMTEARRWPTIDSTYDLEGESSLSDLDDIEEEE